MDGDANENFASAQMKLLRGDERETAARQSRFIKRIRDAARRTMEQSILGLRTTFCYCKTNPPVPRQSLPAISPLVIGYAGRHVVVDCAERRYYHKAAERFIVPSVFLSY